MDTAFRRSGCSLLRQSGVGLEGELIKKAKSDIKRIVFFPLAEVRRIGVPLEMFHFQKSG
jgi:hypothetical protein